MVSVVSLSSYEVVAPQGMYVGPDFYRLGSRLSLTDTQAYYLVLSGAVKPVDVKADPLPLPVPVTDTNTFVVVVTSGEQVYLTLANLVNLFPALQPPKGDKGDKGDRGDKGDPGDTGPSVSVNGKTGSAITLVPADIGLGDVQNLAPSAMPVSVPQAAAIAALKAQLLNGAGAAYDTLGEIQAILQADDALIAALMTSVGSRLVASANLLDLVDKAQARLNLGAVSQADLAALAASVSSRLLASANLSDLTDKVAARTALGAASQVDLSGLRSDTLTALGHKSSIGRTAVTDADYQVQPSDVGVSYVGLAGPRTVTLCDAGSYPSGQELVVDDETGSCSATNTITVVVGAGTGDVVVPPPEDDKLVLASPYASIRLRSNGANLWKTT